MIEQIQNVVWGYVVGILTTPQNLALLVLSWGLVEAAAPLLRWVIASPAWNKWQRVRLYELGKLGKRMAATLWCLALVWVPYAQPPLCDGPAALGCQTVIQRLTTAVVLGLALSVGHNLIARLARRTLGKHKLHAFICANCRSKINVEYTADPCPKCGVSPHEVTGRE